MKRLVAYLGGPIAAFGAAWALLTYLDATPVLSRDLAPLVAQVKENTEDRLRDELRELRIQRAKAKREVRNYQLATEPIPDWLIEEIEDLNVEIDQVETKLEQVK